MSPGAELRASEERHQQKSAFRCTQSLLKADFGVSSTGKKLAGSPRKPHVTPARFKRGSPFEDIHVAALSFGKKERQRKKHCPKTKCYHSKRLTEAPLSSPMDDSGAPSTAPHVEMDDSQRRVHVCGALKALQWSISRKSVVFGSEGQNSKSCVSEGGKFSDHCEVTTVHCPQ